MGGEDNVARRGSCSGAVVEVKQPSDDGTIRVVVRVRPLSTVEHANPSVRNIVQCLKDGIVVNGAPSKMSSRYFGAPHAKPRPRQFNVDQVFHHYSSQFEVYEACRHVIAGAFEGVNGSVLAYGSTGSGKTHTMFGGQMSAAGVIYQAVQDILETKSELEENEKTVTTRCSFMEVYNEKVYDLLAQTSGQGKRKELNVQELTHSNDTSCYGSFINGRCGVNPESLAVRGLTYCTPETADDFARCVERGHINRFVASTDANAHSSRSHAIFTVEIEVKDTVNASLGTVGRIRFCDLAGSERAAGSSNRGDRLREGGNINRSLLALSAVVQELVQRREHPERTHYIPYRGSKLTRLLQDSIGGNCRTLMLFCISPSSMNYEETINTMLFAMQAKKIRVTAKRHEFAVDSKVVAANQEALIEELRAELALARDELLQLRGANANNANGAARTSPRAVSPPQAKDLEVPTLSLSAQRTERDWMQLPLEATGRASMRSSTRTPKVVEAMELSADLQKKTKSLSATKELLYREMREAEEAHSELNMRLRQQKWKLVRFLSAKQKGSGKGVDGELSTSVGVAGQQRAIKEMEVELTAHGGEIKRLREKMDATDKELDKVRQELLREKQHPFLELLLDNVKLRQNCTEAECLAAHYHQEYRAVMSHEEEFSQALSKCVQAIKSMLPLTTPNSSVWEEAQLALMYANLPSIPTADIIHVVQKSMRSGRASPMASAESRFRRSSTQGIEARLQYQVSNGPDSRSLVVHSSPKKATGAYSNRSVAGTNTPLSGNSRSTIAAAKCQRTPKAMTVPPRPVTRPSTRQPAGATFKKPPCPKGAIKVGHRDPANLSTVNGKKNTIIGSPCKEMTLASSRPHAARTDAGKAASPTFSRCATRTHVKFSEDVVPFTRSLTFNGISRTKARQSNGTPSLRERHNNFTPPRRMRRTNKDYGTGEEDIHPRRVLNDGLEERFKKLLDEVKLWHSDKASTDSGLNVST
ncbi:kinesin, putative [Trypanosoma brucei gambiense DAL972]|uniref:Kinesin-like protein n=1 Tax=Trypanosoma brucei gambiense (strain MHOM/CI/86/DAL972) TaxID=679716 RepID=D0A7F3_TRYB9|nr:kinesin, putative [Trypanosoma brucei gambiense DAL972]CBH17604.1 kinesin, putative [Trypanosoma brucei gambiense DAL972]|eukprot:XP_011779868.1 kinesin, putative [Trypanosoma brucei gambiense DAL972]